MTHDRKMFVIRHSHIQFIHNLHLTPPLPFIFEQLEIETLAPSELSMTVIADATVGEDVVEEAKTRSTSMRGPSMSIFIKPKPSAQRRTVAVSLRLSTTHTRGMLVAVKRSAASV